MIAEPTRTTVPVSLGDRSYEIVIGAGELNRIGSTLAGWLERDAARGSSATAVVVTDRNVLPHADAVADRLRAANWRVEQIVLEPGEQSKRLAVISGIYDRLVAIQADRKTVVLAVGGGVVGDAAGFAAATYNRGLRFVQVPTSLLADVDSSVGGKVGVNHPQAKNLIGAFHQPLGVVIDTELLNTLPDRDYRSGLAEVVKYGVILDAGFFEYLEQQVDALNERDSAALRHAIAESCRLKAYVVERDEYETTGLRAVLNYGHTFGHAFEALSDYSELMHGEAVAIGMICASRLAERLGRVDAEVTARQVALLEALQLPTRLSAEGRFSAEEVLGRMRLDKKAVAGRMRFILPTKIGHVELVDGVPEADVVAVLGSE